MFKDMALSKTLHQEFTSNPNNRVQTCELASMQVLTNGNWPIDDFPPCNIPESMKRVTQKFEIFYANRFNNRKLKWLNKFGTVDLSPLFTERKGYQLQCNVF